MVGRVHLISIAAALLVGTTNLAASTIFIHTDATDPTTEGWTRQDGGGPGQSEGAVINDLGFGIDAWNITDASSALGSLLVYSQVPTTQQLLDADSLGWKLTTSIRVVNVSETPDSSSIIQFANGSTAFNMDFGSDAEGDPIVVLRTGFDGIKTLGPSYTLEGVGSTYHDFDLIFNPLAGTADLFVDGIERISNYAGFSSSSTRVAWGALGSSTLGESNYQAVSFSIVPIPASIWLFISGILGIIKIAWRRY